MLVLQASDDYEEITVFSYLTPKHHKCLLKQQKQTTKLCSFTRGNLEIHRHTAYFSLCSIYHIYWNLRHLWLYVPPRKEKCCQWNDDMCGHKRFVFYTHWNGVFKLRYWLFTNCMYRKNISSINWLKCFSKLCTLSLIHLNPFYPEHQSLYVVPHTVNNSVAFFF